MVLKYGHISTEEEHAEKLTNMWNKGWRRCKLSLKMRNHILIYIYLLNEIIEHRIHRGLIITSDGTQQALLVIQGQSINEHN